MYMQKFLQKFNELHKGKKYIEIEFYNDTPLTIKNARYNQGGEVCYCLEGKTTGSQKTKNGWKPIECNEECQYKQKDAEGKSLCNRLAWLKFFIPSISKDRIWLMRITGQKSINRLDSFINIQKAQGNGLEGRFILFLKQEEQTSKYTGKKFNNYVLDILRKEDFIQVQTIPNTTQKTEQISTESKQSVNNETEKVEKVANKTVKSVTISPKVEEAKPKEKVVKKTAYKKETTKKESKTKDNDTKTTDKSNNEFINHYILDSTFKSMITNKNGESKEYLIGKFFDINDKSCEIVIRPEHADELLKCEFGTLVEIETTEAAGRIFALKLKYISKLEKNIVA